MPKTWVKNVHSLWVSRRETRGHFPTALRTIFNNPPRTLDNHSLFPALFQSFPTRLYTPLFATLPLENNRFYTVSTAPTITETKLKKERYL